ncbi:MAG: N-acetyltransferase [Deltaproteobacteria bacterium]|nr:N-acetyltransferase [Deltaproteobacteria bacterium]
MPLSGQGGNWALSEMSAGGVEIRQVKTKGERTAFFRFPWQIYGGDPQWVPPLLKEQAFFLSPKNPFLRHAEIIPYLAVKRGAIVGRIAAIIDENYIDFHRERAGFFGFFESIKDLEVARTLLDQVRGYLREKGLETVMGPVNPSTNHECGLLVEGFNSPPFLMMPYNPSYYQELLEGCGLQKAKDLFANLIVDDGSIPARLPRISERVKKRSTGLNIRPIDLKRVENEVEGVKEVYNGAWRDNWGFVPLTDEEMDLMVRKLKPLVVPDLALFAEIGEETVGFALALPNYNLILKRLNGRLGPLGLLKFLYYARKIDEIRVLILGVKPEYQKRGIEALLYLEIFRRGQAKGYKRGEMSWVLEDNYLMQRGIEALGGRRYKTYRIYQSPL